MKTVVRARGGRRGACGTSSANFRNRRRTDRGRFLATLKIFFPEKKNEYKILFFKLLKNIEQMPLSGETISGDSVTVQRYLFFLSAQTVFPLVSSCVSKNSFWKIRTELFHEKRR